MKRYTDIIPEREREYIQKKFLKLTKELLSVSYDPNPHDPETTARDLEKTQNIQEKTRKFFTETQGECLLMSTNKKNALVGETKTGKIMVLKWEDHGSGLLTKIQLEEPNIQKGNTPFKIWAPKTLKLSSKGEITQKKGPEVS